MHTILVTGATSGIGEHTARALAADGHRVFATGRSEAKLERLARDGLETLRLDVDDPASVDAAAEAVRARTGGRGLDVLINNAGFGEMGPLELLPASRVEAMFETNVLGAARTIRAFVPAMRARGRGRVIQISSVLGAVTMPGHGAYAATKHALDAMSAALRMELVPFGVEVHGIAPGSIDTAFGGGAFGALEALSSEAYAPMLATMRALESTNARMSARPRVVVDAIRRAVAGAGSAHRYVPAIAAAQVGLGRHGRPLFELTLSRATGLHRVTRSPAAARVPVAVVTGAAGGIGRATAFRLAKAGWTVIATDVDRSALAEVGRAAKEQRLPVETRPLDVTDAAAAEALADALGPVELLVNNAGYSELGPIELAPDEAWRAQMRVNVHGLLGVSRAFARGMRARGRGRIVNVSSVAGVIGFPLMGVYCASKHAVEALTDTLRLELDAFGVQVSAVQPAFIRSGFAETAKKTIARYDLEQTPYAPVAAHMETILARLDAVGGEPADVARAILRAARAPSPAPRYRAPASAALAAPLFPWLPTRLTDAALGRLFAMHTLTPS